MVKKATSGVEGAVDWAAQAKAEAAVFLRTRGPVLDKPCKGAKHPTGYALDCELWYLDGPNAGEYVESVYIFETGFQIKMDTEKGGLSAGQVERYENSNGGKSYGFTEMTPEQDRLSDALEQKLLAQGGRAPAGAAVGGGKPAYDDEPPFAHGFADGSNPYREQPVVV